MLWVWLACAGPDRRIDAVTEVYEVPPPPGHRTLGLEGVATRGIALGDRVHIVAGGQALATGDVVLDEGQTLTLYVDEAAAERVLAHPGPLDLQP